MSILIASGLHWESTEYVRKQIYPVTKLENRDERNKRWTTSNQARTEPKRRGKNRSTQTKKKKVKRISRDMKGTEKLATSTQSNKKLLSHGSYLHRSWLDCPFRPHLPQMSRHDELIFKNNKSSMLCHMQTFTSFYQDWTRRSEKSSIRSATVFQGRTIPDSWKWWNRRETRSASNGWCVPVDLVWPP